MLILKRNGKKDSSESIQWFLDKTRISNVLRGGDMYMFADMWFHVLITIVRRENKGIQ